MSMHPKLELIFSWLPDRCSKVFIAGGAAVDFERAADVDLWFPIDSRGEALRFMHRFTARSLVSTAMTPKAESFESQKAALVKALNNKVITSAEYIKKYKAVNDAELMTIGQPSSGYPSVVAGTEVLGWVYHPDIAKPIQVILHDKPDAFHLMRFFDISSHCRAVSAFGKVVETKSYTAPSLPPRIVNYTDANKTILRYFKICARYGHQADLNHVGAVTGKWMESYDEMLVLLHPTPPASLFGYLNGKSGGQENEPVQITSSVPQVLDIPLPKYALNAQGFKDAVNSWPSPAAVASFNANYNGWKAALEPEIKLAGWEAAVNLALNPGDHGF